MFDADHVVLAVLQTREGENIEQLSLRLNRDLEHYVFHIIYNALKPKTDSFGNPIEFVERTGRYDESISQLVRINPQYKRIPQIKFVNNRIEILSKSGITYSFEGKICDLLNITEHKIHGPRSSFSHVIFNTTVAVTPKNVSLIFIYTDIIEYQYVGDTTAPLLRINTVQEESHTNSWSHYDSPHYLTCNSNSISSILIYLKDQDGNDIKFISNGVLSLKLHFRPIA
jgi:hypothetical protein